MNTDISEYLVGAYLELIERCDVVQYNVRPPGGGLAGLGELDVVGFKNKERAAYLCEVTTHIRGLLYGGKGVRSETITKVAQKYARQKAYAKEYLPHFDRFVFQFWSPVVPVGFLTQELGKIEKLELIVNAEYARRIAELQKLARTITHDARNPAFRLLQILARMRAAAQQEVPGDVSAAASRRLKRP